MLTPSATAKASDLWDHESPHDAPRPTARRRRTARRMSVLFPQLAVVVGFMPTLHFAYAIARRYFPMEGGPAPAVETHVEGRGPAVKSGRVRAQGWMTHLVPSQRHVCPS